MVMPYFKKPGLAFTEQQRVRNLRIAIERGKLFIHYTDFSYTEKVATFNKLVDEMILPSVVYGF